MDATQLKAKQLKVKVTTLKSKSNCYTHYAMNLLHEQIRQKIQKLNGTTFHLFYIFVNYVKKMNSGMKSINALL